MFSFLNKAKGSSINVNDLEQLLGKINLIDIREPYEYKEGHIPTAKNIPVNKLISQCENYLDEAEEYYIICQSGARSSKACAILKSKGYKVINVDGGTGRYRGTLKR